MVKQINENEFHEEITSGVSVVDFFATWCGPCKMLGPVMEQVSDELTDVKFFKVDVDDCPSLAQEYRVMNIPAVGVFRDGELVGMNVGFVPKDAMIEFVRGKMQ